MVIRYTLLHWYKCRTCRTLATTPAKGALRCNLCPCYLTYLYTVPVTTPEEQALAARGLVYNPGANL